MAPIVLKVKGNMQSLPFNNDDASDDLSKTWRVCTKVKDSLENGSRLENLSWRLWFAHNTNDNKKSTPVSPAAASLLRNFKVPDDFDFKAQQQKKKKTKSHAELEADYRRKLSLQQKKQAEQKIQDFSLYNNTVNMDRQKEFTLHQFTSDQAGDQVIELDDIFKSFSGDMQSYLNPSEESPTSQQLDQIINQSWPLASSDFVPSSNNTSPVTYQQPSSYQQDYSDYNYNENSSALYVSSEAMPPIPIGTLHNKLLTTLPKETLATAGRLLNNNSNSASSSNSSISIPSSNYPSIIQSTPTTPYISTASSFSTPQQQNNSALANQQMLQQQQQQQQDQFFAQPISTATTPTKKGIIPTASNSTSFTFSHHQPQQQPQQQQHQFHHHHQHQSKSLPPSRAPSPPPPCDLGGSSSSASSSPTSVISPSSSPNRRSMAINSSPSEGKAPVCSNCSTTSTPLWRRSANDELLCNACGL